MGPQFNEVPKSYGLFHIISLVISLIVFVLAYFFAKKRNDKKDSIVVLIISLLLIATEIVKQILKTIENDGNYHFGTFPFQLCSIPMYIGVIAYFVKNSKVKEALYAYIAFTGTLGVLAMLIVPMVIFNLSILSTIHSIFWHVALVAQGVYLIKARGYGKNLFKELLPTIPIITIVVIIAIILNSTDYGFNLISLSTKFVNNPPILNEIYIRVSYPFYCIIVYLGLIAGLFIVDFVVYLIRVIHKLICGNKS